MSKHEKLVALGGADYVKVLDELEWFKYPQNNREEITEKILKSEEHVHLDLHHFSFFSDDFYQVKDYKTLLEDVQTVTGIAFSSSKIELDESNSTIRVETVVEGETIEIEFDTDDVIIVPQVEAALNNLFERLNLESRILWLPLESDIFFYSFIPLPLYKEAVKVGLIPKDTTYFNSLA